MQLRRSALALLFSTLIAAPAASQDPAPERAPNYERIALWPNGAPGVGHRRVEAEVARDYWVRSIHDPSLIPFPAPAADGGWLSPRPAER